MAQDLGRSGIFRVTPPRGFTYGSVFITTDTSVLAGKPVVRGTRLAADFLLGLFAAGWTQEQVLSSYPQLTPEALRAVFAYAAEVTHDEAIHLVNGGAA